MSDSLNATVIVSVLVLMISAKPELEPLDDEDPEPPRLPAVDDPPEPEPEPEPEPPLPEPEDDEEDELEDDPDPPLDTVSPGVSVDKDAIVPLVGA
jgi:hypothetical protein